VGENVLGLVNWSGGLVFHEVQADLEAEGYEVQPYTLPAAGVNAPHRRDRVWFVANATSNGFNDQSTPSDNTIREDNQQSGSRWVSPAEGLGDAWPPSDTESKRQQSQYQNRTTVIPTQIKQGLYGRSRNCIHQSTTWQNFPTQSPICGGNDGIPNRLDGITFFKWRNESIKAYGNAVVPQVVYQIFKAIQQYHDTHP
jgi:DNA (cytosine-5)-methyltransferase 1